MQWQKQVGSWVNRCIKDTLGEAIASARHQIDNLEEGDESVFEIIKVTKTLVCEMPCTHDETDHGICLYCSEDRNPNSDRYGKTVHEV